MKAERPAKPYPEFPLFPHRNGQWAKKIAGQTVYLGPWSDWQAALKRYEGLGSGSSTLKASVSKYLAAQKLRQESGEITLRHYLAVEWVLDRLLTQIEPNKAIKKLTSEDFGVWRAHLATTNKAVALGSHIRRVKAFLNWCCREKIISDLPAGDSLKKPTAARLRIERSERGSRMFKPSEIRKLLVCATPQMRAMILLALNAGLGNEDVAQLRTKHLDGRWLDFPRTKTGVERRVPLWPETREALAAVIRADDDIVFRTKYGNPWICKSKLAGDSPVSQAFKRLCNGVGVYKKGRGFYSLRHVAETVGEEAGDHPAIEYILGHAPAANDMSAVYRERMSSKRLVKVVKYIRKWVGLKSKGKAAEPTEATTPETSPLVLPLDSGDSVAVPTGA
jgi:integrase